jgi:amidase
VPSTLHPELRKALERLAETLSKELGHDVVAAEPSYGIMGAGVVPRSSVGLHEWSERVPDVALLDPRTRSHIRAGALLRGPALKVARALEAPMRRQVGRTFRRFDVVLAPTTAQPPLPVGAIDGLSDWQTTKVMIGACPYAWPWNALGWPAINVPAGLTSEGLPIGAQLLGPANGETDLIALAAQLEATERWHQRRPPDTVPGPTRPKSS